MDRERMIQIIREFYGDMILAEPKEEVRETIRDLGITKEEAEEIGCLSMFDYIED